MNTTFSRFRLRSVVALVASAFVASGAWAIDPFTVRDIRVEGLQRVEAGTIFASLPVKVGEIYNDDRGSASIRALFDLGLFKDVRIDVSGNVLVVVVEERPTVNDVEVVGAKEFDKEILKKALREIGLAEGRPFDKSLTDKAEQELRRQYIGRSLYNATVQTTVTPIERNRVNLTFNVNESGRARINEMRIVGAKAFSESSLLGLFDQNSGGWMSWYTKSDQYSRAKLNADLETLKTYYLTRGYLEFRIDSTQVAISPDREDLVVTVNVTEGQKYDVSSVKLEGNFLGKEEEFKSMVTVRPGQPYNAERVNDTVKAFSDYFGTFGYAFARVQVRPELDRVNNRVALVLQAEPARRVYVRRVAISGNNRSRDEVLRREFRQFEASWYDGDKIRLSRDRIDRLGFFTDVNVETQEVSGAPDQVDININVTEKPTGSLQLGAGFSSAEKVSLTFGVSQENVFGSGNFLGLQINTSKFNRTISLTTTDPYFTKEGISRTVNAYHTTTRPYYAVDGDYALINEGGSLRFGVPFSEVDTVFFGAGLERYRFTPSSTQAIATPGAYQQFFKCMLDETTKLINCSKSSLWGLPLTIGWARDSRDSALAPTSGVLQRANVELGVAGDLRYGKGSYQYQQYFPLTKQYTLAVNGEVGYGKATSGREYPIFKNFYAGGLGSIRGFEQNSLGPRDIVTGAALGGTKKAIFNAELSTPFPGVGNDRTLRLYSFLDVGNVFADSYGAMNEAQRKSQKMVRASVGFGISWISPLGPLRLAYAVPVRHQKLDVTDPTSPIVADRIQRIQFQIGTSF